MEHVGRKFGGPADFKFKLACALGSDTIARAYHTHNFWNHFLSYEWTVPPYNDIWMHIVQRTGFPLAIRTNIDGRR
jgi:hypothetical protein